MTSFKLQEAENSLDDLRIEVGVGLLLQEGGETGHQDRGAGCDACSNPHGLRVGPAIVAGAQGLLGTLQVAKRRA